MATTTHTRICSICEAGCGLAISADGRTVLGVTANDDDLFSQGHVCAKGIALKELDVDPDRLRTPLVRKNGQLQPASWDEAMTAINTKLQSVKAKHGSKSVAAYIGNPTAHNIGATMALGPLLGTLDSGAIFSAGTVDQIPKHLACELMFGDDFAIPVPDILHCDFLVVLGANPVVSNASLWVVPKIRERLRALKQRGGKLVTVDPRRTETARLADQHLAIEPGADAWLLIGLINTLYAAGARPNANLQCTRIEPLLDSIADVSLDSVAARTGIAVDVIENLANELRSAKAPVLYGRIGTTVQLFGTLTSFLIEVVNILIGALDQTGGAMFPEQPLFKHRPKSGVRYNRYQSRVSGYPEVLGQLPVATLAEEIETPGEGQIRALFCFSGNPVVSNPASKRLAQALDTLDLLVCCDIYQTETTRYADVVLPGTSPFEECHYDSFLGSMGYKNTA
ncbi:MAG: molybdopterin-dependent oxidoreductase, partial [Pseudomonadales bacterium]